MSNFNGYWFRREIRSDRLWLYGLFLTLGIAALTLVDLFSARVLETSMKDTKKFLGADYLVRSWRPPPPEMRKLLAQLIEPDASSSLIEQKSLLVSGSVGGEPYNFSVTGTETGFPLYGSFRVELENGPQESPPLVSGSVYLDRSLKSRGVKFGDRIRLGVKDFTVRGFILEEPQSANFSVAMGYRAIVTLADLLETNLLITGARVSHRFLIKTGIPEKILRQGFREKFPDKYWRLISVRQGSEQVARLTGILSQVLVFFAVLASLMGSLTTYFLFRIRIRRKLPDLLTLKCLGLRRAEILKANLLLFFVLAGIGIASGFLIGLVAEIETARLASRLLGAEMSATRPWFPTFLRVCFVAFLSVSWATFFPLREALSVPVNQVFGGDSTSASTVNKPYQKTQFLVLVLMGFSYIAVFSPTLRQALVTFVVLMLASVVSLAAVELFLRMAKRYAMGSRKVLPFLLARGLIRNPVRTRVVLASLLLGLTVVGSAFLVSNSLRQQIAVARSQRTADLVILSPDDDNREKISAIKAAPIGIDWMMYSQARVYGENGSPIREFRGNGQDTEDSDEIGIREYFINYRSSQEPALTGETLVGARALFREAAPDVVRLSVEKEFAERIGARLNDVLYLEIGGVRLRGRIDSLREVNWFNFSPNFFIVAASADLAGAPHAWIALARFGNAAQELPRFQNQIAAASPQSVALDMQFVAERVTEILRKVDATVFWVSVFLMLTLLILVWGITAGRLVDWPQERFLLRSLGLRLSKQFWLLVGELGLLWISAITVAVILSAIIAWLISKMLFKFPLWWPNAPALLSLGVALALLISSSMIVLRSGMSEK